MKQLFQLMLFCISLMTATHAAAQVLYVKSNAAGANNGTSWADAYTSLDAALAVAVPGGQVWVAAGVYKSSNPTPKSFNVQSGVQLYGGFAGTETALSQRNYETNVTILSGDISGNDISGDFTQNRTDNALHVLYVQNGNPSDRAVIDGFRIAGGNTSNVASDPDLNQRGGGILATAKLTVRNCFFTDNFGRAGGCISALAAAGSGLIADNCIFDGNYSTSQSACIHIRQVTAADVNRCIFRNNLTNRGCVYPETSTNVKIDSCLFENNETGASQFGAAMFTWQSNFVLSNSTIRKNTAYNAAGMYNDGRENISSFVVDNCVFDSNTVTNYGGTCLYNWICNFEVKNSTFKGNYAPTSGSAMYNRSCKGTIHDCLFEDGLAGPAGGAGFGGALANYSAGTDITYQGCTFKRNKAQRSGGAMTVGFTAGVKLIDCLFEQNTAQFGGAVFCQNDTTSLSIDGCTFNENGAENNGGAINTSSGITTTIKNSVFFSNSADFGGAVEATEDSLNTAIMNIENTVFRDNFCLTQAGAINIGNADISLKNCLFSSNLNLGTGAGGAISVNATNTFSASGNPPVSNTATVNAVNTTFAANFGSLGGTIAQFENAGEATTTLQNCIFSSEADNYAIESGDPSVVSLGGNICTDLSLQTYLTAANDVNEDDPLFVDLTSYDFHLQVNSPAVDLGTAAGAPATDIEGNARINEPDAGCYENQEVLGTSDAPIARLLQLMPNPAVDFVQLNLEDSWNGAFKVDVMSAGGVVVRSFNVEKSSASWQYSLDVKDLPAGTYFAKARVGNTIYAGKIVKQ
ncbi:MAG: T9SS type A sorting domain-containing protein [Saprospiraceae bacterium]|nr:T9SS type A sorting domain-containing protein [Saprospiraceae bacterium]